MRASLLLLLPLLCAVVSRPVAAETTVVHAIEGRFGVSYASDVTGRQSGLQPLYEGRYTTSFLHSADNGLQFRFDIGIIVGNLDEDRSAATPRAFDRPARF